MYTEISKFTQNPYLAGEYTLHLPGERLRRNGSQGMERDKQQPHEENLGKETLCHCSDSSLRQ